MNKSLGELLNESNAIVKEAQKVLQINGLEYKLSEWITIKEYAKRYGLSNTNVVSNWIERGIIPANDVIEITEFNSLKLVKNKPYK